MAPRVCRDRSARGGEAKGARGHLQVAQEQRQPQPPELWAGAAAKGCRTAGQSHCPSAGKAASRALLAASPPGEAALIQQPSWQPDRSSCSQITPGPGVPLPASGHAPAHSFLPWQEAKPCPGAQPVLGKQNSPHPPRQQQAPVPPRHPPAMAWHPWHPPDIFADGHGRDHLLHCLLLLLLLVAVQLSFQLKDLP